MPMTLNHFGLVGPDAVDPEYQPFVGAQVDRVSAVLNRLEQEARAIGHDARFTPQGRAEQMQEAGRKALKELSTIAENPRRKLELDLKAQACPSRLPNFRELVRETGENETVLYLRTREVRDALAKLDRLNARVALLKAVEQGDIVSLVALRDYPAVANPIPRDLFDEIEAAWVASRETPQARVIRQAEAIFLGNLAAANTAIAKLTGFATTADPIKGNVAAA